MQGFSKILERLYQSDFSSLPSRRRNYYKELDWEGY